MKSNQFLQFLDRMAKVSGNKSICEAARKGYITLESNDLDFDFNDEYRDDDIQHSLLDEPDLACDDDLDIAFELVELAKDGEEKLRETLTERAADILGDEELPFGFEDEPDVETELDFD